MKPSIDDDNYVDIIISLLVHTAGIDISPPIYYTAPYRSRYEEPSSPKLDLFKEYLLNITNNTVSLDSTRC